MVFTLSPFTSLTLPKAVQSFSVAKANIDKTPSEISPVIPLPTFPTQLSEETLHSEESSFYFFVKQLHP